MHKGAFQHLTTNELRPVGWLKWQLQVQAEGLSGHLDLVWPDIKESKWIGGDKEGWERVPYWLDGFIPLAYLLDDEELKKRADRYIDAILSRQEADGWLCPCSAEERERYDVWPAFLIGKVLVLYYECTKDERIEEALYLAMKCLMEHIAVHTLFNWSATRWYECLIPLLWLYERRREPWILDMITLLEAEGVDYEKLYGRFTFERPERKRYWTQINHVVNTAMALKCRALMSYVTGEDPDAFARKMYETLMRHNSMVTGHFTGDECLSGDAATQGSECCSVAEAMFSCEVLLEASGNGFWADLLEREAFNAMPATTTADMWAHQYVQLTNQIFAGRLAEDAVPYNSNSAEANLFGLEPNFGCCTANFNQAWPKFALSAIMRSEDGLAVQSLVPCEAQLSINGVMTKVRVCSEYPFRDEAVIEVTTQGPVEWELAVRIPGFADGAQIDGEKVETGTYVRLRRLWENTVRIRVKMEFEARLVDRPHGAKAAVRGPLVFSLPIRAEIHRLEYVRDGVERKAPYCDYEMFPASDWNYAFRRETFEPVFDEIGELPFSSEHPPIRLRAQMLQIPWEENGGICAPPPQNAVPTKEAETVLLQPYGCTDLRMTEMPYLPEE